MSTLRAYVAGLPEVQRDDDALVTLYAELSGQSVTNANAFRAKIDWWTRTLDKVTWQGLTSDRLILALDEAFLSELAIPSVGRPMCLGVVMTDMMERQLAMSSEAFFDRSKPITHTKATWSKIAWSWIGQPAWQIASGWIRENDSIGDEEVWRRVRGNYVLLDNVEKAAELFHKQVFSKICRDMDTIFSREEIMERLKSFHDEKGNSMHFTTNDCKVLLRYLERDRGVLVTDGHLYKVVISGKPAKINPIDHDMYAVRSMHDKLSTQIDQLEKRIAQTQDQILQALRTKQPEYRAKAYLRTRKQLEDLLEKRTMAWENISATLLKIEQAEGDAEIMHTYETSVTTLRKLLADPALQPERIATTMDDLAEVVQQNDETHAAIGPVNDIDEDEIAKELEQLTLDAAHQEAETESERTEVSQTEPEIESKSTSLPQANLDSSARTEEVGKNAAPLPTKSTGESPRPATASAKAIDQLPSVPRHIPESRNEKVHTIFET
ncbi:hypothetical protein MYAM1_003805 [Malassezia yamatoensis]|uniref:Charged multivesicular body protein 7 n=1 Tax=Malassezia yamatoensis TaxID=253288 RepID=A0AAJ5YVB1_9BASI|nr:hypothetical protein MYAM1_003805 [Malassezia yamatoensis]